MRLFLRMGLPLAALTTLTICALIESMSKNVVLEACDAVGGQTDLARKLGLKSQGSISRWVKLGRVPLKRVIAVESATGIPRHLLCPDLYPDESRLKTKRKAG